MKTMNYQRYKPYQKIDIKNRTWPDNIITNAPRWCSVDLRDGNQSLHDPMTPKQKINFFKLLVDIGFKEIEVGFPSASGTDYDFLRELIEGGHIPDDVTVQVLTQAREHLIAKTVEALKGAKKAVVHLYNSTSPAQRDIVFKKNKDEIKKIAIEGTKQVKALIKDIPGFSFQYSPESFTATEPEYALEICHAVCDIWQPTPEDKIILNLPATVEMSTPNIYADYIEWFCSNLKNRENVIISIHNHNDRGCAVASTELALMAGADRVEGALFGNGERSGNMDLITIALNMFCQGVNPQLDFSNIDHIIDVYKDCTDMPVHPRHPYVGELVYTAFSGSHQDAISKGMKAQKNSSDNIWNVPYLPIDPQDVGRNYEAIIRINSQSGKGGMAYILEQDYKIQMPKWMQPDFAKFVQKEADQKQRELSSNEIYECFCSDYLETDTPYLLKNCKINTAEYSEGGKKQQSEVEITLTSENKDINFTGTGNGPINAFVNGLKTFLGIEFTLEQYSEHAISHGDEANAVAFVNIATDKTENYFGAGIDTDISIASFKAIISALNNLRNS